MNDLLRNAIAEALHPVPDGINPRRAEQGVLLSLFAQTLPHDHPDRTAAERFVELMKLDEDAWQVGSTRASMSGLLDTDGSLTDLGAIQARLTLSNFQGGW